MFSLSGEEPVRQGDDVPALFSGREVHIHNTGLWRAHHLHQHQLHKMVWGPQAGEFAFPIPLPSMSHTVVLPLSLSLSIIYFPVLPAHCAVHFLVSLCSQRVHLDISIGEAAVDYAQVAAKEKLTELQLRIRQLLDQVEQISKEQAYQRVRQKESQLILLHICSS